LFSDFITHEILNRFGYRDYGDACFGWSCAVHIKSQRKTAWSRLYYCHLNGDIVKLGCDETKKVYSIV
jgi:hypothetical protein